MRETAGVGLGAPELLIIVFLFVIPGVCVWAAIDAGSRPEWAFEAAGTSKVLWIVLPLVGIFVCFVGVIPALIWFTVFRSRVRDAVRRGPSQGPLPPDATGGWGQAPPPPAPR